VKTSLVGPSAPGFVRNGGYHHFYANDKAIEGYRTGTFPDGSVLVDDGLEAVEKEGVSAEGARRRVAVMLKDSRRFGQSRNWAFEVFPRDSRTGTLDDAGKAACLACHQRADRDLVYSQLRR
jgi:cytochrome P460